MSKVTTVREVAVDSARKVYSMRPAQATVLEDLMPVIEPIADQGLSRNEALELAVLLGGFTSFIRDMRARKAGKPEGTVADSVWRRD